ncbi:hypothetical protein M5D96_005473 [Drosophila gunungcola]|uniref:Peptidoglycan-recognition protein n=1 Tax=Drosophila gunungcola TaxID=103775 RepID=A0A9P9YRB1_9MUSC|nr:hypothetical protein M5D96_005473 [Drosophila gunungcola]
MNTSTAIKFVAALALCSIALSADALQIEPRSSWGAVAARSPSRISGAVDYVIIHHSDNPNGCSTSDQCKRMIKNIQSDHKDGKVYEGRGFGLQGSHAPNYNRNSIGIVFIGNFQSTAPSSQMLQNAKDLIELAKQRGFLKDNYTLFGHRQTKATSCPGDALFNEIKTWPHWRQK